MKELPMAILYKGEELLLFTYDYFDEDYQQVLWVSTYKNFDNVDRFIASDVDRSKARKKLGDKLFESGIEF